MEFRNIGIQKTWEDRYQKNGESLDDNFKRVAKHIALNTQEEKDFYDIMSKGLFMPAGRTMSNAGVGETLTLNNCFLNPIVPDDMAGIFECVKNGAMTHKAGGGIGYDFSHIRPKNTPTSNDAIASGVISFMDVFNTQTATVQQGSRRGANMGTLNIYHPDIYDFIDAKSKDENKLNHFNLSIMIDDNFMTAVKLDQDVSLHYPVYDEKYHIIDDPTKWKIERKINAKDLWDKIMLSAYNTGEPGILFYDTMNRYNNTWYTETITHTNPCGEFLGGVIYNQELPSSEYGGACNLGSLFLHNFVVNPFTKESYIDVDKLYSVVSIAVRMLDNIIDINKYPLEHYENYQKNLRTIGLGVTGLADMLAMLKIRYDSQEALVLVEQLMENIKNTAYITSVKLAIDKGAFPLFNKDKFLEGEFIKKLPKDIITLIANHGIRNARLISIAPTGTMSLTFGNNCSSGIEPIFSLEYDRKVRLGGQDKENETVIKMEDYAYSLYKESCIKNEELDNVFSSTAMNITVDAHIDMLKVIAKNVDMSISKTINVPTEYPFEDTKNIYMKCWEDGIKGCTIFRPNKIRQGILITTEKNIHKESGKLNRGDILDVSDDLLSVKRTIINGCGKFYIHSDFDEVTGEQMETFIEVGSGGGCERNLQFISRLISLALRSGIPIEAIIDQATSIRGCNSYINKEGTSKGTCCPSAIGFALEDLTEKIHNRCFSDEDIQNIIFNNITGEKCPECDNDTLTAIGGCNTCISCGYSHCE